MWNDGVNLDIPGSIDIYLAYSRDRGENWEVVQVTNGPAHAFMPAVAADANGAHVQYSRFGGEQGVGDGTFALFMKAFSVEGGLGEERMVSSVFSPVPQNQPQNFDPGIAGCYMGDYNQIVPGPGLSLLHSWSDNRNSPEGNNPDVFFIQTASRPVNEQ